MRKLLLIALLLAGCSGGGGSSPPPTPPSIGGWTQFYGSGVSIDSTGSFNIPPAPGSVQYVAKSGSAKLGQTVTLKFQITGSGTWGITDPTDTLPPKVTLLLWENGDPGTGQGVYETYREWCGRTVITTPGSYTVSCVLNPANWTGVFGQTSSAAAFQQLLNNLYGVGFTFGGNSYSGHGVYSATGSFHFTLDSYTIQ